MVTSSEAEHILCVLFDCMPATTQKLQKLILRQHYKIQALFDDIKRQYGYDNFLLKLEAGGADPVSEFFFKF